MKHYSKKLRDASKSFRSSDGFTLMEVVIAVLMFSIFSVIVASLYIPFNRNNTDQQVITDVVQKIRSALGYLSTEIRGAGLDPSESNNFGVITADSTTFTYELDTPDPANQGVFDGVRNVSSTRPERKTFRFLNGNLEEVTNLGLVNPAPTETLVPMIDPANSSFEYLDEDRNIIPSPVTANRLVDIRSVRVSLSVEQPSGVSGSIGRTMETVVLCRNLYFNGQR